jgi:hypothetical protein
VVSAQVAMPLVLVCGVHRRVWPVVKDTGWPLSGRPAAVRVAVRVRAGCGLRPMPMLAVSAVGTLIALITDTVSPP